ncbi:MAG: F0F1 ATP synthase subunit epsilon [Candidatus Omnitrophica bacterium]|nr:F0F1 ATP synthase subunit epsilon [Candidatus Omnitrophota bacterium]
MRLKILLPGKEYLAEEVRSVKAESKDGYFGLLPKHIDTVVVLVPGVLSFVKESGPEEFVAVDEGVLVKTGKDVTVSVMDAFKSADLESLVSKVEEEFTRYDEKEKKARTALARMEADFTRRLYELELHE